MISPFSSSQAGSIVGRGGATFWLIPYSEFVFDTDRSMRALIIASAKLKNSRVFRARLFVAVVYATATTTR